MKSARYLLAAVIILSLLAISAASWHSVEEIHYLKTFYPARFTVEEAFWASLVELIKIHIIAMPLLAVIVLCLYLLSSLNKRT
ncbi:MAG: hypothetical protein Q8P48_00185 [Deltaproteobacteria bacterium]|nr:hypothetical protein [Deltaproteobacteria bacterium]